MIQVGDWVMQTPTLNGFGKRTQEENAPIRGQVCYIHPQGRYCVVEFEGQRGRFRESYFLGARCAVPTYRDTAHKERGPKCPARAKKGAKG